MAYSTSSTLHRPGLRSGLFHRSIAAALLVGMAGMGFAGCSEQPTEIVAGMTTQINVGKDLRVVGVTVRLGGRFLFCQGYDVVDGVARLPSTLGVVPAEARDGVPPVEPVTIDVIGFRGDVTTANDFTENCSVTQTYTPGDGDVRVLRRRRMPYLSDEIVYLPMPLKESCANVACPNEDDTCIGGVCETIDIDNSTLEAYADALIFGNTNTCFSAERCMPLDGVLPAIPVGDPSAADWDCTYTFPQDPNADPLPTSPGQVNVEVIYSSFNTEILDLDAKEGFVLPDPNDPLTFRLSENLCKSQVKVADPKIIGLRGAPLCPAKRALQPICDDELNEIQSGARSPVSNITSSDDALCTVSLPLTPADSALYVLLDKSDSMREFFSPESLQFALSLSLRNPIAAKTQIAFDYLTSNQPGDFCTASPNPYETPLVPFGDAEVVQPLIAAELANPSGGIDATDGDLDIEIGLLGAYTALGDATSSTGTFNRRAAVVIGNRNLNATCGLGDELPTVAGNALTGPDELYTYVAVLEPGPNTVDPTTPTADGAAIATAGGTTVFDGVTDPTEGALAVQKVLSDLGSCVYDLKAEESPTDFVQIFEGIEAENLVVQLSYLDPVDFSRTDIPRDTQCTAGTEGTATGWNRDDSVVRICGQPCEDLRTTLNDTAAFYATQGQPAPEVPIRITVPCASVSGVEAQVEVETAPQL